MFTNKMQLKIPMISNNVIDLYTYTHLTMCNSVDKSCENIIAALNVDNLTSYNYLYTQYSLRAFLYNIIYYLIVKRKAQHLSTYTPTLLTLYNLYIKRILNNEVIY